MMPTYLYYKLTYEHKDSGELEMFIRVPLLSRYEDC